MSKRYLTVYNLQREKDWVLKNAYDIIETREINTVWSLEFSIPMNDQDMEHCQPYWYVRYGDDGQLYRFTDQTKTNANESSVTYHCEHVICTLVDDVMFQGPYIKGNTGTYTYQVLNYILDMQTPINGVRNWKLGTCEPRRQFEYSWENENLLAALWSVPTCFGTPYMWTFDTSEYPWTINLVNIDENADPDYYLMAKKNILQSTEESSSLDICTRLYGLGEGEGVNQLTIKSVNNGLPYVQSSPEIIAKYGIVSRIFVDRRYQYPETLKAKMETLLHELEKPTYRKEFDIVDLYDLTPDDMYKAEIGKIALLKDDNTKVYITKIVKNWSEPGDMKITFATKATDMSSSIADLADRQRIEQVYSQGASQVYSFSFFGNATSEYPLDGFVYFPADLKYLNEVKLKVMLKPFRSYSKATDSKTVTVQSCENKVVTVKTNQAALGGTKTTESGGGTTSSSGGTSVTVSGGGVSGQSTGSKGVSVSVTAEGISDAPQETTTSAPNTNITSGTVWAGDNTSTTTEGAPNGYVDLSKIGAYGGTYEDDGGHEHSAQYVPSTITGGEHKHEKIETVIPDNTTKDVEIDKDWYGHYTDSSGKWHIHDITFNSLSHEHNINHYHTVKVSGQGSGGSHKHSFSIPDHTHTISSHSHNLPDLSHSHNITLNGHSHEIKLNGHSHEITPGIFESGSPTRAKIYIDDVEKLTITDMNAEVDLTQYLVKNGYVPRGEWIKISVKPVDKAPNDMAYISVFGITFAYIQSYTGGNY